MKASGYIYRPFRQGNNNRRRSLEVTYSIQITSGLKDLFIVDQSKETKNVLHLQMPDQVFLEHQTSVK
jgi:hypothetical protein